VELRSGFIIGIFNYCDRWCDACPFTSRCRLFADKADMEASLDPGLKALVETLLAELDQAILERADGARLSERPIPFEHLVIKERARDYGMRVHRWRTMNELPAANDPGDPSAVVLWFETLIGAKIDRAIRGLADDDPDDRDWPPDYDGSAKVALLGIERSHAAWLDLVDRGIATGAQAAPFVSDLEWLGAALERVFPHAREFVRPGLDEPEEVSRLTERERAL
jgi:hypothetical protein